MKIYNLNKHIFEENIDFLNNYEDDYFIIGNPANFSSIAEYFKLISYSESSYKKINENIRFEHYEHYDFISFVSFEFIKEKFVFEKINSYFGKKFLIILIDGNENLYNAIINNLDIKNYKTGDLWLTYYNFLNISLERMFDSLSIYENFLTEIELKLIENINNYEFEKIINLKRKAYEIKKYLRHFLYVGDQIIINENKLISPKNIRYFKSIDIQINRIYEFSESICEKTDHLMDLYDSTITSKTNNLINKLTIFTVFATPLTVISGIYGMNFVNMPELEHENAYFIILGIMVFTILLTYFILKKIKLL